MRSCCSLFAVALLAFVSAPPAGAAVLPLHGTLSIAFGGAGSVELTGSGIGSSAGGVNAPFTLPLGALARTSPLSVAITPPGLGLSLIQVPASPAMPWRNAAGSFGALTMAPFGGNFGGVMGNNGVAGFWAYGLISTTTGPGIDCGPGGGVLPSDPNCLAGQVPLVRVGGGPGPILPNPPPINVVGVGWQNLGVNATTPTKTVMIQNAVAGIPVTLTATAFDHRTAGGKGTVQLVAPTFAKLNGGALGTMPIVGTLTIQFVPEPGTLLLMGSGLVGLVVFGRNRARS